MLIHAAALVAPLSADCLAALCLRVAGVKLAALHANVQRIEQAPMHQLARDVSMHTLKAIFGFLYKFFNDAKA